eukprot:373234_1
MDSNPVLSDNEILIKTNEILSFCELQPRFSLITDIQENASSICVAILERLLQQKLSNINRNPKWDSHYISNAQIFVDEIKSGFLKINLPSFVTAKNIYFGDKASISAILNVLSKVVTLLTHIRSSNNLQTKKEVRATSTPQNRINFLQQNNYDADDDISEISTKQNESGKNIDKEELNAMKTNQNQNQSINKNNVEITNTATTITNTTTTTTTNSASVSTFEADRSPISIPIGFDYNNYGIKDNNLKYLIHKKCDEPILSMPNKNKKKRKVDRKSNQKQNNKNKRKLVRPMSARTMSSYKSNKSIKTPHKNKRKQIKRKKSVIIGPRIADEKIYKQILSSKLSLQHKNDKLYKYSMKKSNSKTNKTKIHLDENRLIRIIQKQQKEKMRSDLRWLEQMENKLERELILKTIKQKSDEEIAIERVEAEAKKLEKEYLRNYHDEYKKKFELLRKDLESKTKSIQHFFADQYAVLNEEKEALKKINYAHNYSQKVELSKLKKELKSKKEAQLQEVCQFVHQINLNGTNADAKDLHKLNKMIKNMVKTR